MNLNPALVQIGKMIAVDVCFNNSDRIPTIWESSDGNPLNFLFKLRPDVNGEFPFDIKDLDNLNFSIESIVAIDNGVTPLSKATHEDSYNLFVQRADTFVSLVFSELTTQSKDYLCLKDVISFFERFFDYKLDWY